MARCVAFTIVRCSVCSLGLSAGLAWQLNSHGSMKKLMFTTSTPIVAGVDEAFDRRLEEDEAGVLADADVHQRHVGRDAGHADAVDRRADLAGHVCAVAVVVLVDRVDAARVLARTVDRAGCR